MTISNYSANSGEALYFDEFQQISGTQPDSPKEIGIVSPNFANMTDVLAALTCLANSDHPQRQPSLDDFYRRWHHDPLVLDKWFAIQAASSRSDTLEKVRELLQHPDFTFDNPNRVRSLVGVFSQGNPAAFHEESGGGYLFLADQVLKLDSRNPRIAARLLTAMTRWRRYDDSRRQLMCTQLERIADTAGISKNVYEITSKSLTD